MLFVKSFFIAAFALGCEALGSNDRTQPCGPPRPLCGSLGEVAGSGRRRPEPPAHGPTLGLESVAILQQPTSSGHGEVLACDYFILATKRRHEPDSRSMASPICHKWSSWWSCWSRSALRTLRLRPGLQPTAQARLELLVDKADGRYSWCFLTGIR